MENIFLSYWGNLYTWKNIFKYHNVHIFENIPYNNFQRGVLNRTTIISSQGIQQLSIPIQGGRKNKISFKEVKIDHTIGWQKTHYRSIMSCYGKSPWWKEYEDDIQKIYEQKKVFLLDWNKLIYEWISFVLECNIDYVSDITFFSEKENIEPLSIKKYQQVFGKKFCENVFILDAILCQGEKQLKYYLHA